MPPTRITSSRTATVIAVITRLALAVMRIPRTSRKATSATIAIAGRLMTPPSAAGGPEIEAGSEYAEDLVQRGVQVGRPADRDGRGADDELEREVPADDERDQLAERRVGERVRAARDRHHGGELGVAERGERADDAGQHERQHDRGPGLGGRGVAGEHEDAGADDDADAEHGDVERAQLALEREALLLGSRQRLVDGPAPTPGELPQRPHARHPTRSRPMRSLSSVGPCRLSSWTPSTHPPPTSRRRSTGSSTGSSRAPGA